MAHSSSNYPASLQIDYPERPLNKLTTLFRPFLAIPILLVLLLVSGGSAEQRSMFFFVGAGGVLFFPVLLLLLFRQKYPKWWFDWNLSLTRFSMRCSAYLLLLRDEYPSTDEDQAIHLEISYPDATKLSAGMPLVKWFLAIPHVIVLSLLSVAAIVCVMIAWFAILYTGNFPRGLFDFVVGVLRWSLRVMAYACLLTTDVYPPFSLEQ